MKLPFTKMHGLGNDFVVIDQRNDDYALSADQLRQISDRRTGIGCDQILFIEPARMPGADARYRVANADGSAAEHCGNGVRCVARFLERAGAVRGKAMIEIGAEVFELRFEAATRVRVDMGRPRFEPATIPLVVPAEADRYQTDCAGQTVIFGAVSLGNPHAVIEVPSLPNAALEVIGPALQSSSLFPASVNVGFMQIDDPDHIQLRVYERGAGETRACGTGACAAVAIGRRWQRLGARVEVSLAGGTLQIEWDGDRAHSLWMIGPATFVFEGAMEL